MILNIAGDIPLSVVNLKPDTSVKGSKMQTAELLVEKASFPCVIRRMIYGNVQLLDASPIRTSIIIFPRLRHTAHTRVGFVDVQITTKVAQFCVYVHVDHLESFLSACTTSVLPK